MMSMSKGHRFFSSRKERKERQMEILNSYFDMDLRNRKMGIPLRFESYDDVFDTSIGRPEGPHPIRGETISLIERAFRQRPRGFKVDITISIKDLKGHSAKDCEDQFGNSLLLSERVTRKYDRVKSFSALILLVVGMLILVFNSLAIGLEWVDENTMFGSIFTQILTIAAWVFVWESVTIYFIERTEDKMLRRSLRSGIDSITVVAGKDERHVEAGD